LNEVEVGLYGKLAAGTALTALLGGTLIYNGLAPQGRSLPYVLFSQQSGVSDNATPTRSEDFLYQVKGLSASGMAAAGSIASAIDTLLHNTTLTVSGWTNYSIRRERHVRYEETESGERVSHAGAVYRIRISQ